MNVSGGMQCGVVTSEKSLFGHTINSYCRIASVNNNPLTIVITNAPINPSHVFLGDNRISGVRPKKNPTMYAQQSLDMISSAGSKNQINPWKILMIVNVDCTTINSSVRWIHANISN